MSSVFEEKITKVYNALMNRINASIGTHNTSSTSHSDIRNTNIHFGQVDNTSTSTVFTATVPNLTALVDGTTVMLKNGVVTSETGFTINVNGLGAKPVYSNLASATQDTTIFNINYTMLFVYDSTRISGGCWICYRGYDSNTNTIGYQIRTNSTPYTATDKGYRYRLWLETDDNKYMPVNLSTSTNATANRSSSMNTREFWIGGNILYNSTNGTTNANATMSATTLWKQYTLALGYSFNNTGSALVMNYPSPVYMVAEATSNGKARLHTPYYTQTLPSTEDGLLYIYLGHMYSETSLELALDHPIYEYKNNSIRLYQETYTIDEVDDLLDGKSDTNHTHSNYASSNHSHGFISNNGELTNPILSNLNIGNVVVTNAKTDMIESVVQLPYSKISGTPTIPTKTSDLTNDGADGTNIFVSNNDSRLSDARTPTSHTHSISDVSNLQTSLNAKQETLISGTNIKTINNQSLLGTGDITVGDDVGSFTDLQSLIDNASSGDIIILDKDYQNTGNENGIIISKSLIIEGKGHTIDADNKSRIMTITGSNNDIIINKVNFINGYIDDYDGGGAISQGVFSSVSLNLNNCLFYNNQILHGDGGAVQFATPKITNCIFINNKATDEYDSYGGAIYCSSNAIIKNCVFKNNTAQTGNDVCCNRNNLIIYDCDTVSANLYNTTNKPYLTDHQDISGKIDTAGTGLTKSNTTLNHSNNVIAQSSSDVRAFTYDAQGHITGSTLIDGWDILVDERDNPVSIAYAISQLNTGKASSTHTHGNLQNNGQVGTSNNASKNVVTDSNGHITTEAKPTIDTTITSSSSNAVTSGAIYSALSNKQNNLSSLSYAEDENGNAIFEANGDYFYGINNRIYHDVEDTNELHFLDSNDIDVNFDDIILEGDSRLTNARTPTTHTHGNINNNGTITTVKTIDSNTNVGADYFIIRDNNDSNSTKSANVLDVLNKIVLDLIDEG